MCYDSACLSCHNQVLEFDPKQKKKEKKKRKKKQHELGFKCFTTAIKNFPYLSRLE